MSRAAQSDAQDPAYLSDWINSPECKAAQEKEAARKVECAKRNAENLRRPLPEMPVGSRFD